MSSQGAYSPSKVLAWPDRVAQLKAGQQPYPVHLHLILSDLCDLSCPKCAYRLEGYSSNQMFGVKDPVTQAVNNNPNRMLHVDLVKSVLDDCKVMGTQAIEFTGGGEPTIHPHAREVVEYAQNLGLDTALITNGLHIPRMGVAAVRTLWLRVSLDAATPETYAKVRPSLGGPTAPASKKNFKKALDGVEYALKMRQTLKTDCTIGLGFVVQEGNWREIYNFVKLAFELGVDNVRISGAFTPEGKDHHMKYWPMARAHEKEAIAHFHGRRGFQVHGRFGEKIKDLEAPPDYARCLYQELTTYLGGDGNLYRCCVTSYNTHGLLGNVEAAGGFKKLWESKVKKQLFKNFDARSCTRCQFNDRNREIAKAVDGPAQPEPEGLMHKSFI